MPIQRPAARRKIVHAAAIQLQPFPVGTVLPFGRKLSRKTIDRKSTRLNSSHSQISYAVFCLKKKTSCRAHYTSIHSSRTTSRPRSLEPLIERPYSTRPVSLQHPIVRDLVSRE